MADTYESYDLYIRSARSDEFRELFDSRFENAGEYSWRESIEIDEDLSDDSYDVYIDSDRDDEFRTMMQEHFKDAMEWNWRETLEV